MEIRDQLQQTPGGACTLDRELGGGGMSQVFFAEGDSLRARLAKGPLSTTETIKGDRVKAVEHYLRVIEQWKNADPELQVMVNDLRCRVRRLTDIEGVPR